MAIKKAVKAEKSKVTRPDGSPECFGSHEDSAKCRKCWFHRDCKKVK